MRHALRLSVILLSLPATVISCHKSGGSSSPQLGRWTPVANFVGRPTGFAVSFVIGDSVAYVGLGYNENLQSNNGRMNSFYAFKPKDGWSLAASFPGAPRSNAVGFALGNCAYVGTGWDGASTSFNDFYQYDPSGNQWAIKAPFPGSARYDAVGFGLLGKGYIGTGYNGSSQLSDFYQYDPQADSWASTPVPSADQFSPRSAAVAFEYNNKAYIVTGRTGLYLAIDFWSFDPSNARPWTRLHDIIEDDTVTFDTTYTDIVREYAMGFVNGDHAYLTGGTDANHPDPIASFAADVEPSTWAYDFATDVWGSRTVFSQQPRYGAAAFTINGKSYVGCGLYGSGTLADFNQFIPSNVQ